MLSADGAPGRGGWVEGEALCSRCGSVVELCGPLRRRLPWEELSAAGGEARRVVEELAGRNAQLMERIRELQEVLERRAGLPTGDVRSLYREGARLAAVDRRALQVPQPRDAATAGTQTDPDCKKDAGAKDKDKAKEKEKDNGKDKDKDKDKDKGGATGGGAAGKSEGAASTLPGGAPGGGGGVRGGAPGGGTCWERRLAEKQLGREGEGEAKKKAEREDVVRSRGAAPAPAAAAADKAKDAAADKKKDGGAAAPAPAAAKQKPPAAQPPSPKAGPVSSGDTAAGAASVGSLLEGMRDLRQTVARLQKENNRITLDLNAAVMRRDDLERRTELAEAKERTSTASAEVALKEAALFKELVGGDATLRERNAALLRAADAADQRARAAQALLRDKERSRPLIAARVRELIVTTPPQVLRGIVLGSAADFEEWLLGSDLPTAPGAALQPPGAPPQRPVRYGARRSPPRR